ncbi:MAG: hypothetical protein LC121_06850 [Anaerolineae bacterium]|nr:hypothetical protein [Anaerolineae bacterium]
MIHKWSMTPADQRHADLLARWFRLKTEASQARTGRKLRQIRAELAEVNAELAALESGRAVREE